MNTVKKQADELRGTRLAMQDLTSQEASACLNLRRANTQLTEAQRVIDAQEDQIRRQRLELAERRPAPARGESSSSSAITGGVDPAAKGARPFVGPTTTTGVHHQGRRSLPLAKALDQESGYHSAQSACESFDARDLEGEHESQVVEEEAPVRKADKGGGDPR